MPKMAGSIWVETTQLHYINASADEYYYAGTLVSTPGGTPVAGSVWVENNQVHYITEDFRKFRLTENALGAAGASISCVWVDGNKIYHVSDNGQKYNNNSEVFIGP